MSVRTSNASSELANSMHIESKSFSLPPDIKMLADSGQAQPMSMFDNVTMLVARIANLEELVNGIQARELTAALTRYVFTSTTYGHACIVLS